MSAPKPARTHPALPRYLHFLDSNGRGPYSGFDWPIGEWVEVEGDLIECQNGIHVTTIDHATVWLSARCHPAEVRGDMIEGEDKLCVRAAKLGPALDTWNDRTARLFAADCAEHVLHIFERERPNDSRPRNAIEVVRRFANGEASADERDAAKAAAKAASGAASGAASWAASGAASWAASGAASRAASVAASMAAAGAAAGDAARAAEREWQVGLLARVLRGDLYAEGGVS